MASAAASSAAILGCAALLLGPAVGAASAGVQLRGADARPVSAARTVARTGGAPLTRGTRSVSLGPATQLRSAATVAGTRAQLDRGRAALAELRLDWESLLSGWTIEFLPPQSALLGMTLVPERRVEIYVRAQRPVEALAHDIAHELGHVADVRYNDNEARGRYLALRGFAADTDWWACSGCRDLQVPAGDFAETFALAAAPAYRFYGEARPEPTATEVDSIVVRALPDVVRALLRPVTALP